MPAPPKRKEILMSEAPPAALLCFSNVIVSTPATSAALDRLHVRKVPVLVIRHADPCPVIVHAAIIGMWLAAGPRELPPRPGLILRAAREAGVDLARSWLIGVTADEARAAGQAGLAGCVLIGDAPGPTVDVGLVVARARDFADAPRVMIPRGGGCWHGI